MMERSNLPLVRTMTFGWGSRIYQWEPDGTLGEYMPLDVSYQRSTVFVLAKIGKSWRPIGTGFFVVMDNEQNPNQHHAYIVTAAHVVKDEPLTGIRFRTVDGQVIDKKVPRWIPHPTADVAVTDIWFDLLDDDSMVQFNAFLLNDALDIAETVPRLGTTVYFVGLLDGIAEMGRAMVPMVRSGSLGAYNQPGVPLVDRKTTVAHLIDCRSFYGFSGSPCVIQESMIVDNEGVLSLREHTRLMGVLTGHYDDTERQLGEPTMKIHIGVGIVQPVERVREVIYGKDLTDVRRAEALPSDEREITPDSVGTLPSSIEIQPDEADEFQRFEVLTRGLLSVPKSEVDELRDREKD
jgi:trypsin-like peptidase